MYDVCSNNAGEVVGHAEMVDIDKGPSYRVYLMGSHEKLGQLMTLKQISDLSLYLRNSRMAIPTGDFPMPLWRPPFIEPPAPTIRLRTRGDDYWDILFTFGMVTTWIFLVMQFFTLATAFCAVMAVTTCLRNAWRTSR